MALESSSGSPKSPNFKLAALTGHIPAAVISQIQDTADKFNITAIRDSYFRINTKEKS